MSKARLQFSTHKPNEAMDSIDWKRIESSAMQSVSKRLESDNYAVTPSIYQFHEIHNSNVPEVTQELQEFRQKCSSHFRGFHARITEVEDKIVSDSTNIRRVASDVRDMVERVSYADKVLREQKHAFSSLLEETERLSSWKPQADQSLRQITLELTDFRDAIPQLHDVLKRKVDKSALDHIIDSIMQTVQNEIRQIAKIDRSGVDLTGINNDSMIRIAEHACRKILQETGICSSTSDQKDSPFFPPALCNSLLVSGIESCIESSFNKLKSDLLDTIEQNHTVTQSRISEIESQLKNRLSDIESKLISFEFGAKKNHEAIIEFQSQITENIDLIQKNTENAINILKNKHDDDVKQLKSDVSFNQQETELNQSTQSKQIDINHSTILKSIQESHSRMTSCEEIISNQSHDLQSYTKSLEDCCELMSEMNFRFTRQISSIESVLLTQEQQQHDDDDDDDDDELMTKVDVTCPTFSLTSIQQQQDDDEQEVEITPPQHQVNSIQCTYCLRRMNRDAMNQHLTECELRTIPCPNKCGQRLLARNMAKHCESCSKIKIDVVTDKRLDQWSHQEVSHYLSNQLKLYGVARRVLQLKMNGAMFKNLTDDDLADAVHGLGVVDADERDLILLSIEKLSR